MSAGMIENTIAVLPVRDLERSVEFYRRTFDFELEWKTPEVCSVKRDGCSIMLRRSNDDSRAMVWIGLEDASLFTKLGDAAVTILQAPTKQPWAYEMKIADPDGNTLWLGTDPDGD